MLHWYNHEMDTNNIIMSLPPRRGGALSDDAVWRLTSGHFVKWEQWERFSGGLKGETSKASRGRQWGRLSPSPPDFGVWALTAWSGDRAPARTEFVYSTAESIILVTICNYVDDNEVRANRSRVSIRVAKLFGQGRWRGRSCCLVTVVWSPCKIWLLFLVFCARVLVLRIFWYAGPLLFFRTGRHWSLEKNTPNHAEFGRSRSNPAGVSIPNKISWKRSPFVLFNIRGVSDPLRNIPLPPCVTVLNLAAVGPQ